MKIRSTAEFANSRTKSGCVLQKNGDSLCECRELSERVVSSGAVKLPCFSYRGYMYIIIEIIIYISLYMTENTCIAHSFRQVFGQAYTCIYIILHKLTYVAYVAYHCIPWHEDTAIPCSLSLSLHYMTFALHLPYIAFQYLNDIEWKWLCLKVGQAAGCGQSSLAHLSPAKGWKWWLNDIKCTWW